MWMEGEILHIAERPMPLQRQSHVFEWGRDLISFSASLSIAGLVNRVEVVWHDPETNQDYVSQGSLDGSALTFLQSPARQRIATTIRYARGQPRISSQKDAETRVQAMVDAMVEDATSASATIVGTPGLRPGMRVTLRGIGSRFSGEFNVRTVTHSLGAGGYRTTFQGTRVL
jgi:phage protein D